MLFKSVAWPDIFFFKTILLVYMPMYSLCVEWNELYTISTRAFKYESFLNEVGEENEKWITHFGPNCISAAYKTEELADFLRVKAFVEDFRSSNIMGFSQVSYIVPSSEIIGNGSNGVTDDSVLSQTAPSKKKEISEGITTGINSDRSTTPNNALKLLKYKKGAHPKAGWKNEEKLQMLKEERKAEKARMDLIYEQYPELKRDKKRKPYQVSKIMFSVLYCREHTFNTFMHRSQNARHHRGMSMKENTKSYTTMVCGVLACSRTTSLF